MEKIIMIDEIEENIDMGRSEEILGIIEEIGGKDLMNGKDSEIFDEIDGDEKFLKV